MTHYGHLIQSKGEYIAGPVPELVVEGHEAVFEKPVEVIIPHCVRTERTGAIRVFRGNEGEFEVSFSLLILGSRWPLATLVFASPNPVWRAQMVPRFATLPIPFYILVEDMLIIMPKFLLKCRKLHRLLCNISKFLLGLVQ